MFGQIRTSSMARVIESILVEYVEIKQRLYNVTTIVYFLLLGKKKKLFFFSISLFPRTKGHA